MDNESDDSEVDVPLAQRRAARSNASSRASHGGRPTSGSGRGSVRPTMQHSPQPNRRQTRTPLPRGPMDDSNATGPSQVITYAIKTILIATHN